MPCIESPTGVEIYYEEDGEGRPLVMLHGWSMTRRVWGFQQPLADDCRLIVPDLRGHGRSSTPAAGYSLDALAGDIVALFERLDLTDAVLLGWSLGAQVALAAFLPIRKRLAGLVLVGATPRFTVTDGYPYGRPKTEPRGMELRLKRNFNKTMGEFFRSMFVQGELDSEQETRTAREIVMAGRLPELAVALATLDILATADLREMLPAVDLPTLVIHGSADAICPAGAAHFLVGRIADARLVEFDGAGHAPFLSRPDEFNAMVREFLREVHGRN